MELHDKMIRKMLKDGYIEIAGVNMVGDEIYRFTPKFYDEQPDVVKFLKETESDTVSSLWFKGFIDIKMDEDSNPYLYLTPKSNDWYTSDELTKDEKSMMYVIYSTGNYYDRNEE
jgi:hypothetical protein